MQVIYLVASHGNACTPRTCISPFHLADPDTLRKRKLKCDAHRPTCNNCSKPRVRGIAARMPAEACTWDAARVDVRRRSIEDGDEAEGSGAASGTGADGGRSGGGSKSGKRSKLDDLESRLGECITV